MRLLEHIASTECGAELKTVREDAGQVLREARVSLAGDHGAHYHVPRVESVIGNLLPHCADVSPANVVARAVTTHARNLISDAHPSQSYPARHRLRVLLYSAGRLMTICRAIQRPLPEIAVNSTASGAGDPTG
ncbi:hypothetical protein ACH4UR_25000 [Streptomyces lydicus]|uniref:hypothetical protein n=1 Tax=Streptomyces lydicus TaxID=47763 RepID=UPI0033D4432F